MKDVRNLKFESQKRLTKFVNESLMISVEFDQPCKTLYLVKLSNVKLQPYFLYCNNLLSFWPCSAYKEERSNQAVRQYLPLSVVDSACLIEIVIYPRHLHNAHFLLLPLTFVSRISFCDPILSASCLFEAMKFRKKCF